jgi:F0F1-type ATP synthase membrane subunit b/b'
MKKSLRSFLLAGLTIVGLTMAPAMAIAAGEPGATSRSSWLALLVYVMNAAIFAYLCIRWGKPLVVNYFVGRARSIREHIEKSRGALTKAEQAADAAAAIIARLEDEKAQLMAELEHETSYQIAAIRDAASRAAERIKSDIAATAAAAAENARRRLRARLAESAGMLAREIVHKSTTDHDQHRMIDRFISRLSEEAHR